MAIFSSSLKVFCRSKGQTSTAAAAYRAALKIGDERTDTVHDYSLRLGVEFVETFAPPGSPAWARDPARLWNAAELAERINGRPAREWLVALPHELSANQRHELVRDLARDLVDRYQVAVMAAVHEPSVESDQRNFHVHLLFTTRRVGPGGLGKKVRELDDRVSGPQEVERLRSRTAELMNQHLSAAGRDERVDHRRLSVQAEEAENRGDFAKALELTKSVERKLGRAATAAVRRGERSDIDDWNRSVRKDNREVAKHYLRRMERATRVRPTTLPRRASLPPSRRVPRRPTMPSSIVAAMERSRGAFGPGGHLINQQSRQAREQRRENEAAERRFVRMLEEEMARIHRNNRTAIAVYSTAFRLQRSDVRALGEHCARDPDCARLVRRSVAVRQRLGEELAAEEQRRASYGAAMVRTASARTAVEDIDMKKPRVPVMRRREWAEFRRRQRAALAEALVGERAAAAAATSAASAQRQLSRELSMLEDERRKRFPLPGDAQSLEHSPQPAQKPRQKIGNKIRNEGEGDHTDRPRPSLAPHPHRRRRPRA